MTKQYDASDEGQAVLHSIMDHELEAQAHVERVVSTLGPTAKKLKALSRRLYNARAKGELTRGEAKRAWREGFLLLALWEYASDVGELMRVVDASLEEQYRAVKAFAKTGRKLTTLRPIRNVDIKARATAKAQAKDSAAAGVKEAIKASEAEDAIALKVDKKLKGPGPGRLPDLDKLRDKTPDELVRTLDRFGVAPDLKAIDKAGQRIYESRLEAVIEDKATPDAKTWEVLDAEVESAVTRTLRQQTKEAIRDHRLSRIKDSAQYFVWVATGTGSCDSCEGRHGDRRTMAQWETKGLPGSKVLVCKSECRCSLVPDLVDEDLEAKKMSEGALRKIVIGGGCRCGKTTAAKKMGADLGLPVFHSDDLIGLGWEKASTVFAETIRREPCGVFEGVAASRALRKLIVDSDAKPCDVYVRLSEPFEELSSGQAAMNKGEATVFDGIRYELEHRGVDVRTSG